MKPQALVLVIDDDVMTRMLIAETLEPEGFAVDEAESGAEGIAAFERRRPDIVLLDVTMPGMDGFECCRRLRGLPGGGRVPIVVLTGNDDDASIAASFDAGATDFAAKPMRWKLLAHRVRYLLRASGTLDELTRSETSLTQVNDALVEMNEKFSLAHAQLLQSEKLASLGQLAAGVAHEINNPVGYIISNFGTLETYLEKLFRMLEVYEGAEQLMGSLEAIARLKSTRDHLELSFLREDVPAIMEESLEGLARIKDIVLNLKDFARLDSTPEWHFEDIHGGIESTLKIVNNEIKYKAEIIKQYGDVPKIECILPQLNQVFMNIIVNAAFALPDEGGKIIIRTEVQDEMAIVQITDNGAGISEEHLTHIFEPFFTTKPVGKGTGLGLSIVYGIVTSHHGQINVDSTLGVGTTFRITLPVRQSSPTL